MIQSKGGRLYSTREVLEILGMDQHYKTIADARRSLVRLREYAALVEGADYHVASATALLFTADGLKKLKREWKSRADRRAKGGGRS